MNQIHSHIKPPVSKKKAMLPHPPEQMTNNLEKAPSATTGLLQFHVPMEIKREFKIMAAGQDMSQTKLFLTMFEKYKNIVL